MAQENIRTRQESRITIDRPHKYSVIFHNDDFTTMEFVVMVLERIFSKTEQEAEIIMLDVHRKGKGVVGSYSLDMACTLRDRAMQMARKEGFPLKITVEQL